MATYSKFLELVNGIARTIDLSSNTLQVQALQVGAILLSSSSSGTAGSTLVGDDNSYSNFTPAAATVKGALSGIDTALGSVVASTALDGTFRIKNTADNTKQIAFSAASITTSTTRTITMPDANVDLGKIGSAIQKDGSVAFTANQPMGGFKLTGLAAGTTAGDSVRYEQAILVSGANAFAANQSFGGFKATNLANPVSDQDAATKIYVDNLSQSLTWKTAVRAATTGTLPANTYANGTAGVGATLTGNSNGALTAQDGVTLIATDRLLVKNEATGANNGIYVLTQVGDGSNPYILTRAVDMDSASEFFAAAMQAGPEGATQGGFGFRQNTANPITVGTTAISFINFSVATSYSFNNGLALTGSTVNVVPGDNSLTATAGSLVVKLDGARAITVGGSGIGVNVDNSSIDISGNAVEIKAAGVTATKVNTNVFDQSTITGGAGSAAAVQNAPKISFAGVAGQSFSANTTYAVRYGLVSNSETAGRIYAADITTSSFDLFWVIGFIQTSGAVSSGGAVTVVRSGSITLQSADSNFVSTDTGKAVWLQASGAFSMTAPSSAGQAAAKLAIVTSTTTMDVQVGQVTVN